MPRKAVAKKVSPSWTITFEGEAGADDDYKVEFFDVTEEVDGLCLVSSYIDRIGDLQEINENYIITADLKYIASNIQGDLSDRFFLVIFAENNESETVGLLLAEHGDGDKYPLLAVWPLKFYQTIKNDLEYLNQTIGRIVDDPEAWKKIEMILPVEE
jgi:hypothetical protein